MTSRNACLSAPAKCTVLCRSLSTCKGRKVVVFTRQGSRVLVEYYSIRYAPCLFVRSKTTPNKQALTSKHRICLRTAKRCIHVSEGAKNVGARFSDCAVGADRRPHLRADVADEVRALAFRHRSLALAFIHTSQRRSATPCRLLLATRCGFSSFVGRVQELKKRRYALWMEIDDLSYSFRLDHLGPRSPSGVPGPRPMAMLCQCHALE